MEKNAPALFRVSFTLADLPFMDEGSTLDAFARCLGQWTWNECMDANIDYLDREEKMIVDEYDFDACTRDMLNEEGDTSSEYINDFENQTDYLFGDWLMRNDSGHFDAIVQENEERIRDLIDEESWDDIPPELAKAYKEAQERSGDSLREEWLKGDRSTPGLLHTIGATFTDGLRDHSGRWSDAAEYVDATDTLWLTLTEEQARDWLDYELGEDEPVTLDVLKASMLDYLQRGATKENLKRHQASLTAAERQAYQEAQRKAKQEKEDEEARQRRKNAAQ